MRIITDEIATAMNRFWDSATDVANAAMAVSKQINQGNPDELYMLGLFHNVGVPMMMQRFENYPDVQLQAYASEAGHINVIENELINTSHQVIGFYIAKAWKLPEATREVIRVHHSIGRIGPSRDERSEAIKRQLFILKMAEHISGLYRVLGDQEVDHEWNRLSQDVLAYFGLSEYEFEDVAGSVHEMGIGAHSYFM